MLQEEEKWSQKRIKVNLKRAIQRQKTTQQFSLFNYLSGDYFSLQQTLEDRQEEDCSLVPLFSAVSILY